jgi:HSP20 family protein
MDIMDKKKGMVMNLTKNYHKEHLKAMKCYFDEIMDDTARNLDNARFQIEESIINHDLLPGKTVYEEAEHIVVKVIIPGIKKENLNLNITESQLTIEATFNMENYLKSNIISLKDEQTGTIKRRVNLPKKVIPQEATANLDNGILTVEIPKLEKDEQFNIKIE